VELEDGRLRRTLAVTLTAAVNLFWMVAAASAVIATVLGMMWAGPLAEAPAPEGAPGSGVILRTQVTAIWVPRTLRDLALQKADPTIDHSPEEVQACLERSGSESAWYALTYRGHQVNHDFADITQVRPLSEAANHTEELQAVMATAARRPPRCGARDFSHARVKVIPDTMQAMDPREAITRLMAEPLVGENCSPTEGVDSTRRTQ
jgi:hypothetical protein